MAGNMIQHGVWMAQEGLGLPPQARELFSHGGPGVSIGWRGAGAELLGNIERLIENLDLLYVLAAPTEQMAGVNWADAGGSWLSRSGGEGAWVPYKGWKQPDPGSKLSTNFTPSRQAVNFEAQCGEIGVWIEGGEGGECEFGADKLQVGRAGRARWGHRSDLALSPTGDGLTSLLRVGQKVEIWHNSEPKGSSETPWSELDSIPLTIGRANSDFSKFRVGGGLVRAVYLGAPLHSTARKLLYVALARFFLRVDELKAEK